MYKWYNWFNPITFVACHNTIHGFPMSYVVVFVLCSVSYVHTRGDCPFCWYWWNWWPLPFKQLIQPKDQQNRTDTIGQGSLCLIKINPNSNRLNSISYKIYYHPRTPPPPTILIMYLINHTMMTSVFFLCFNNIEIELNYISLNWGYFCYENCLNGNGHQFHQYQQNGQSPLVWT
jgi:hypothetical protein